MEHNDAQIQDVIEYARNAQKISLIRALRQLSVGYYGNLGLKEAKDLVEAIASNPNNGDSYYQDTLYWKQCKLKSEIETLKEKNLKQAVLIKKLLSALSEDSLFNFVIDNMT